jgi:hypothetical protein
MGKNYTYVDNSNVFIEGSRVSAVVRRLDKAHHDNLVSLVEKMLALTPNLRVATSESEKAALLNAITTTDAEIDHLVYEIYGLTEEEIKTVESEY